MKGEERYLLNLLEGTKTRFVIPVYQRNYDWKIENCKQLFDDLEDVISEGVESHFFGSIVSKADGPDTRIVIDGQQRITTSYLLLIALVSKLREGAITSEDDNLADMINEEYLIDKWHKSERKLKLKLIKDDQAAFEAIYSADAEKFIQNSNVTQNFIYFCGRINKTKLTADQLREGSVTIESFSATVAFVPSAGPEEVLASVGSAESVLFSELEPCAASELESKLESVSAAAESPPSADAYSCAASVAACA